MVAHLLPPFTASPVIPADPKTDGVDPKETTGETAHPYGDQRARACCFCLRARLKTIAGIAAFALFLNACASIPTTSAIYSAEIKQEHVKQNIRYLPAGPKAFQTQEETVEGFVLAGAGVSNNFAVAREFIAPEHKNSWAPLTQVYITQGGLSYTQRNPKQKNIVSASTLVVGLWTPLEL